MPVVFDARLKGRLRDTAAAAERRIRKAIRDGVPKEEVARMIDDHIEWLCKQRDGSVRAFLRYRNGRDPTDAEVAEVVGRMDAIADELESKNGGGK